MQKAQKLAMCYRALRPVRHHPTATRAGDTDTSGVGVAQQQEQEEIQPLASTSSSAAAPDSDGEHIVNFEMSDIDSD